MGPRGSPPPQPFPEPIEPLDEDPSPEQLARARKARRKRVTRDDLIIEPAQGPRIPTPTPGDALAIPPA